jgi:hypothetical protein
VQKHPVATKRALRAILKATDLLCFTDRYDYALQALGGIVRENGLPVRRGSA